MLSITHLKKSFGDSVAVDDVSFDVRDGETVGLLGPNGAGKTTTLSMMSGIAQPDGGSVSFRGQLVRPDADELKRCVGLVTQDLALYDELSTWDNLELFGGRRSCFRTGCNRLLWPLPRAGRWMVWMT